jgi:disulfide oxidoreductase YuzD
MRIEIIEHNNYFYWLIVYNSTHSVEGYSKTMKDAMKEILMYTEGA